MKKQYMLIESHEMEEFGNRINDLSAQGYSLVSHSLAIDTNAGANSKKNYSAVLRLESEVSEIKKDLDVSG